MLRLKTNLLSLALAFAICGAADADELGRWCDKTVPAIKKYDALLTIRFYGVDGYAIESAFADGSKNVTETVRDGAKFLTYNEFGEYYVIRNDGQLGIFDAEGLVRVALPARGNRAPGSCR